MVLNYILLHLNNKIIMNKEDASIQVQCFNCHNNFIVKTTQELMRLWIKKKIKVQEAFPKENPSKREVLISGVCGACFDEMVDIG